MGFEVIAEIPIIKRLQRHEALYEKFKNLVNGYSVSLDSGALIREIGFTPHDFSHHCKDIYCILDKLLPEEFYQKYSDDMNLFLLLTAVLLHDYSMSQDMDSAARREHSKKSMEYIKDEMFRKQDSLLVQNCDKGLGDMLGDIIYAHSDIKSETGGIEKFTFLEIVKKYEDRKNNKHMGKEEINVPFLSAILRLADELDISYKRIENTRYKEKKNIEESMLHYRICEFFDEIQIHNHSRSLSIEVIDGVFDAIEEESKPAIAGQIIEKYLKVKREFDVLYREVLSKNRYIEGGIWEIEKIELKDESKFREYVKKNEK